jgi:hypothetical protein
VEGDYGVGGDGEWGFGVEVEVEEEDGGWWICVRVHSSFALISNLLQFERGTLTGGTERYDDRGLTACQR